MQQVVQNFKTGELYVSEFPAPSLSVGKVLVENKYSLISAGTEKGTISVAQANLLGKAKQRPDLVVQVIQNLRKEGVKATLEKVKTKLDSLKALGYSTAGEVLASLDSENEFKPGTRVACAGQDYASHAEIVSVPQNLVVRLPDEVSFEEASFTTVGAIALQGVRQCNPKLGDNVCVIGLGLLGQITSQILLANGCNVFGVDLSQRLVDIAIENGIDGAVVRNSEDFDSICQNFVRGKGFDCVIITAATNSNDPIETAAVISRKRGRVVVVGAVKMEIPRELYYKKELELRLSCSYGPGRYDVFYEEEGKDYPYAYVRWTEKRNMEAFLGLLAKKKIDVKPLITHVFDIADAVKAYDIILGKEQIPHMGVLLKYPKNDGKLRTLLAGSQAQKASSINVGFIGAGSFAQSILIPKLRNDKKVVLDTVVTAGGTTAANVARKFGFRAFSTSYEDVFANAAINTIFIATPHNSHADLVISSLARGKHVFVEKPLAMNQEELDKVAVAISDSNKLLMTGFNRRFSPSALRSKGFFNNAQEPLVINYRVNAGFIPKDHWTQIAVIGGGRVIGEMCHFIDFMQFLTGAEPVMVYAASMNTNNLAIAQEDNISVNIQFKCGSVGHLLYVANGDKRLPKERIEIFGAGKVAVIDDFKRTIVFNNGSKKIFNDIGKGHKQEVDAFIKSIVKGDAAPISFSSLYLTTLTTFKIWDSLRTGLPQKIDYDGL
jgi:polar amino acid transport system substrate-binding protein